MSVAMDTFKLPVLAWILKKSLLLELEMMPTSLTTAVVPLMVGIKVAAVAVLLPLPRGT